MVKGNPKSSATSATRKKHLKKHEQPDETPKEKKQKGKKGQKKEVRVKMYIPPVKPAPVQPDPLETTGLAHSLPADLLVVLRNISKKAQVTKTRALEDLQSGWVNQCLKEGKDSGLVYTLVEMLPVWLHHVSALFINPSRRIRFLAASLHSTLLQIPPVREQIVFFLRESASTSQLENVLGTWCLATHDVDRSVASTASRSWKELAETLNAMPHVDVFVQRVILDPSQVYVHLNPQPPPPPPPAPGKNRGKAQPHRKEEEEVSRSKQDEQEESEQDRKARLRIGGLGAARWILSSLPTLTEEHQAFYSNPAVWTILHHAETAPWAEVESFGFAQPNVRKAGWSLLQTLLTSHKDRLEPLLATLSTAVLRSAWVESDSNVQSTMWQPLLTFLKQFPQCWTKDADSPETEQGEEESDSDDEGQPQAKPPVEASTSSATVQRSRAYEEFLQFLRSGCSGSPMQGYQTVVIVVSTIPTSILTSSTPGSFSEIFAAFWDALDSRALSSLHRLTASAAFLSSLLECIVFLVKRIKSDVSSSEIQQTLIRAQFERVWQELSGGRLKVEERAAARLLSQTLESLFSLEAGLFEAAWEVIVQGIKSSVEAVANASLVSAALKVFYDRFKKGTELRPHAVMLMKTILEANIAKCGKILETRASSSQEAEEKAESGFELLVSIFDQFREGLFFDDTLSGKLDDMFAAHAYLILLMSPLLLLAYLINRKDESKTLGVWNTLLSAIASSYVSGKPYERGVVNLLDAARHGRLPKHLKPQSGELDNVVGELLEDGLTGRSSELAVITQILLASDYFISPAGLLTFLRSIILVFTTHVWDVVAGDQLPSRLFDNAIQLVQATISQILKDHSLTISLLPDLFLFAYLFPVFFGVDGDEVEASPSQKTAATLWNQWLEPAGEETKSEVINILCKKFKDILWDTSARVIPEDVLHTIVGKPPGFTVDLLKDIFPSSSDLDASLEELSSDAIDYSIAIIDPLVPPSSTTASTNESKVTDYRGFSSYARIVNGLLHAFTEERSLAKSNFWALRHFHALSLYAQDLLNIPSASSISPVFDDKVSVFALRDIVNRSKQISVYLFNSAAGKEDEAWRRPVIDLLLSEKNGKEALNQLQTFLFDAVVHAKKGDTTRDTRILKIVLDPLFSDGVDATEADLWIQYARKIEKTAPQTAMTIVSVIATMGAEPPKLDRYRNELAAGLLGIKPAKANTGGLLSLRKLAASVPNPEGEAVFLQPPRAINVIKACQAWVLAEGEEEDNEELDEEVQSAMLPIFMHLAPILQNVPGGHWAFIFDVLETTLELSSGQGEDGDEDGAAVDQSSRFVGLARALRLVYVIEDLVKTNKGLRADWQERRVGVLTMIRDLSVIGHDVPELSSKPRSICRELALSIVRDLPPSLIDENTLSKMCHLIEDPSPFVQKMAYQLLKAAAKKRTEHFVIEAGVDTEATVQVTLPNELLEIVSRQMVFSGGDDEAELEGGESTEQQQNIFGYLLGWMLIFDLFQDASFKVRSSYIEQLRNLNVVFEHFIPCFLAILRLDRGGLQKAFKLDIWAVDYFYVELYEPGNPHTIPVLTAHVFYRALLTIPSLIHSWVLDCKDRQLTNTVTNYTSTHFSPVLIRAELEHVRAHSTKDGLADDNLSIKVAPAVNEVVAAYSVDEHQLEIRLKVPGDWPLHKIEVRDVKRVGVDENRWRAWVLGVQQTIWSHNGRIIDGLGMFKKNVTLHFEGQVECAICYSIISVMDGTLPKKPCKTCKNRFHAGCLYKWFNTSHSSSCPLCRSDII
ncbi:hypothetical protein CPC08DRAFT_820566 [Agrocybe pediades]|nr:hypothetical protein CPC08DRAFT_820566 [Agrocybe pediades]